MMKKQLFILLTTIIAQFQLVCQTYVFSPEELITLSDSVEHLGISYNITPKDFDSRVLEQVKSIRIDVKEFQTTKILAFTPNVHSLVIESDKIGFLDWKDLPRGITTLKLGSIPKDMKHFDPEYLPKGLKEIHLRGKWDNQQLQYLLEANTHLEKLVLEELPLNEFPIGSNTIRYLGLVDMNLSKAIVFGDFPLLNVLFIDECKAFDMTAIHRMEKISEITIQDSEIRNHYCIEKAKHLKELTERNSQFKAVVIDLSKSSLSKVRLTNIEPHAVILNTPSLRQLDLSNNGKMVLTGLEQFSNQLTHFYAYETTLTNVGLMDNSFQNLSFFGGLENIDRKSLPKDFIEYACSTCSGTLRRVPNDW